MHIKFTKMHGLGNDFMVVDGVTQKVFFSQDMIKRLADRHFGVGFDQLLLVEPPYNPEHDFHYRIFNQDGSEVQMCGNGARCFARFVVEKGLCNKKEIKVSTLAGELTLYLEQDDVIVNMGTPVFEAKKIPSTYDGEQILYPLTIDNHELNIALVSMGNPHLVLKVDDIDNCNLAYLGPILEAHSNFPEHINVGFMQIVNQDEIKLRVYERGCGETLACGSGACAAAVSAIRQGLVHNKVKVHLKGGSLIINWNKDNSPVMMQGSATTVYEGVIKI